MEYEGLISEQEGVINRLTSEQEGVINRLTSELKQTKVPARTISWQHNNIGSQPRITQRVLVARKQRKQINSKVASSNVKIMSLRESILGLA